MARQNTSADQAAIVIGSHFIAVCSITADWFSTLGVRTVSGLLDPDDPANTERTRAGCFPRQDARFHFPPVPAVVHHDEGSSSVTAHRPALAWHGLSFRMSDAISW
jgi:hypothetical protein